MSATQNIQHQPTTALVDNVLLDKNQRSGPCKTKLPEWSRQERRPDAPSFLNSLIILINLIILIITTSPL
jgi:hypothetical protein